MAFCRVVRFNRQFSLCCNGKDNITNPDLFFLRLVRNGKPHFYWGFSAKKPPVQPGVGKNTLVNGRENLLC